MKTVLLTALVSLASTAPALAQSFTINLDGRHFTCTEGGARGGECECRISTYDSRYFSAYYGEILLRDGQYSWSINAEGLAACKRWIRESDACK